MSRTNLIQMMDPPVQTSVEKEEEKMIHFKGPTFPYQGRQVTLSGKIKFHSLLTQVEPDWPVVNQLESELVSWISKQYKGEEGHAAIAGLEALKHLKDTPLWSYFTCRTLWGEDSKEKRGKMLSFSKCVFLGFVLDEILEHCTTNPKDTENAVEMADRRRQFLETSEPFVSKLYGMQFITKNQLREMYMETEFGRAHPEHLIHMYAILNYMKEFIVSYNMLHPQQVKDAFVHWMKANTGNAPEATKTAGDEIDSAVSMNKYVGAGIASGFRVVAMLDQLRLTKTMMQDENVQRIETLAGELERNINHLTSLEREILEGDPLNGILVACNLQGLDFETALDQHLRKCENLLMQFQNTFDFIMTHYTGKDGAVIRRYAEIVAAGTAAFWPIMTHLGRFSKLDIWIVSEDTV